MTKTYESDRAAKANRRAQGPDWAAGKPRRLHSGVAQTSNSSAPCDFASLIQWQIEGPAGPTKRGGRVEDKTGRWNHIVSNTHSHRDQDPRDRSGVLDHTTCDHKARILIIQAAHHAMYGGAVSAHFRRNVVPCILRLISSNLVHEFSSSNDAGIWPLTSS